MSGKASTLTQQIRRATRECGLSQRGLARLAGIDPTTLCRFLAGERGLTVAKLDALAAALRLRIVVDGKPTAPASSKPLKQAGSKKGGVT